MIPWRVGQTAGLGRSGNVGWIRSAGAALGRRATVASIGGAVGAVDEGSVENPDGSGRLPPASGMANRRSRT